MTRKSCSSPRPLLVGVAPLNSDVPSAAAAAAADVVGSVRARFSPDALDGDLLIAVQPTGTLQVGCYEIDHRDDVLTLVSRLLTAFHQMQSA